MAWDLDCYGDDINALADLAGDFDLRSPTDTRAFYTRAWESIAGTLGFSQLLTAEFVKLRGAIDWPRAAGVAGVSAFAVWLRQQRPNISDNQALVQGAVLRQLIAAGRERGELWRVSVDPTTLDTGACYTDDRGGLARAFYLDTAPGYFGDGWTGPPPRAESRCGWQTPLVLHLGTFPWVYSSRLDGTGPGLRWSSPTAAPAVEAFRIVASTLDPATNLRQDARQVASIFRHFQAQTATLVARLPLYRPGAAEIGRLHRRAGLLHVHQGSLHVAGLDGPRGHLPATAHNYILRRFADFFAVRRATVQALATWTPEMKRLAASSADPCLRAHAEGVARAG
jgi:hypothetical protein